MQPELLFHFITDLELLDLAGDRHWELRHKSNVSRDLVMGNLALAEGANGFSIQGLSGSNDDPSTQFLPVFLIGHAHHLYVLYLG